jgi:hypothetical protein
MLANPAQLAATGSAAAIRAQPCYGWERIAVEMELLYRQVLAAAQILAAPLPGARS